MRVTVPPTFSVVADTLTERLVTVCVEGVVAVGAIGEGLESEPPQPLHRATTTARQAAWRAGMTGLSLTTTLMETPILPLGWPGVQCGGRTCPGCSTTT